MTTQRTLRIAQITDIHLTTKNDPELYGVDTAAALESVLLDIDRLLPAVDVIIATGDLVEAGHKENYQRLRTLLLEIEKPVFVLPGNHDDTNEMKNTLAGGNIYYVSATTLPGWMIIFVNSQVVNQGLWTDFPRRVIVVGKESLGYK